MLYQTSNIENLIAFASSNGTRTIFGFMWAELLFLSDKRALKRPPRLLSLILNISFNKLYCRPPCYALIQLYSIQLRFYLSSLRRRGGSPAIPDKIKSQSCDKRELLLYVLLKTRNKQQRDDDTLWLRQKFLFIGAGKEKKARWW